VTDQSEGKKSPRSQQHSKSIQLFQAIRNGITKAASTSFPPTNLTFLENKEMYKI